MSRSPLAWLLLWPLAAAAAPVPKVTPKLFEGFGTAAATTGVTFDSPRAGELRVSVSPDAATASRTHREARPLVTRTVEGDFELTVRVTHALPGDKDLTAVDKGDPQVSAGLALYSANDPKASVVLIHRPAREGGVWGSRFGMSSRLADKGSDSGSAFEKLIAHPLYLRLTRKGDEFTSAKSDDGQKWTAVFHWTHPVPGLGAVDVGPVAAHNTNGKYDVTFDEYTLTTAAEKKK